MQVSRDQKPGKMRVVGGGRVPNGRRRDVAPVAAEPASPAVIADQTEEEPRRAGRLLPLLFVSGCAIGGAALPLMRAL